MKADEFKKILKPLIRQTIKEVILDEGVLSGVISEVVKGLGTARQPIVEQKQNDDEVRQLQLQENQKRTHKINETRKKMLDVIGRSSYNGVDLFEGTTPMPKANSSRGENSSPGPLSDIEPGDPGVDISGLMGNAATWKTLAKG